MESCKNQLKAENAVKWEETIMTRKQLQIDRY